MNKTHALEEKVCNLYDAIGDYDPIGENFNDRGTLSVNLVVLIRAAAELLDALGYSGCGAATREQIRALIDRRKI